MNQSESPNREIFVLENHDEIIHFACQQWLSIAQKAIQQKGKFTVALSGGRTPAPFYAYLANATSALPWNQTHIFMVDERFVPQNHIDSNFGMIHHQLLRHIQIPSENLYPVTIKSTVEASAHQYEGDLKSFFGPQDHFPSLDLMLMGIGTDGHTASLFPGNPAVDEKLLWVIATRQKGIQHERISLTLPVLNHSQNLMFVIQGRDKAQKVVDILEKRDASLPAALVESFSGRTIYLLDREAASLLKK